MQASAQRFEAAPAGPGSIVLTEAAVARVAELIATEGKPGLKLRVFVQGGGCSGFQYGFALEEAVGPGDRVMTQGAVSLLVDAASYPFLAGTEIDYRDELQGAQFVVNNPNAEATCGCGSSFTVAD